MMSPVIAASMDGLRPKWQVSENTREYQEMCAVGLGKKGIQI